MTGAKAQTIGLLGVGHLMTYLVPGLLRATPQPRLILSPRNADKSAVLAERHGLEIAPDNAALVAASDIVLLATRPAQVKEAVAGLPWQKGQVLVTLCAGVPLNALSPLAAPAILARAMPITAGAIGESPTCLFPDVPAARCALAPLGPILVMADEAAFEAAAVSAAVYGWAHALIGELADWSAEAGLPPDQARDLVAQTLRAAAAMVQAQPERPIAELLQELATPGGITEHGFATLRERGSLDDWRAACDAVLARLK